MMQRLLPELAALALLPLLVLQGRRTRRVTPRLPEAAGPDAGCAGAGQGGGALRLLAIGESPVAGVGVDRHDQAITGQLAVALAARLHRPVQWRAIGRNGATAGEALQLLLPQVPAQPVDVVLLAFGVNDTTAFSRISRWCRNLLAWQEAIDARCRPGLLLICGVPPVGRFPALPQPLRWVMGLKASVLDAAARDLARRIPRALYVPLALDPLQAGLMASDGYHPSEEGCRRWAQMLADASVPLLAAQDEASRAR